MDTYVLLASVKVNGRSYEKGDEVSLREAKTGWPSLLQIGLVSLQPHDDAPPEEATTAVVVRNTEAAQ